MRPAASSTSSRWTASSLGWPTSSEATWAGRRSGSPVGKAEIASYVKSLPADLAKVGSEASKEIGEKFEQLENDVNAKQDSVVDTLATKYVEARQGSR